MRDIIFSLILLGLLPSCFRRPFVGLIVFSWLAYMRAQDLTWGFARNFRWSYTVALVTFAGWISDGPKRMFLKDLRCYIMIVLFVLVTIGVITSENPFGKSQTARLLEYGKIVGVALFTTAVIDTKEHLRVMVWVVALSFAFYGIKSGIWGVMTFAQSPILRGPGGMLADNNDFSLALGMGIPMMIHVGLSERREVLRKAFLFGVPLTMLTVLLTHSRGGLLAMCGGLGVLVWRSKNRVAMITIAALVGIASLPLMPSEMRHRFQSISDFQDDSSAQARFASWAVAVRMATGNPFFGVGLQKFRQHYLEYEPNATPEQREGKGVFVAHNSYLQIWAEVGTPAFMLYLTLILMSFITIWRVRAKARRRYFASWIINYATMFEASLVTFCIGSTFLNRAHFDLFYHFVAIVMMFGYIAEQEMRDEVLYPTRGEKGIRGAIRLTRPPGFGQRGRQRGFRNTPLVPSRT